MNKLGDEHAIDQIKQTRNKWEVITFRDSAIEEISIMNLNFGPKSSKEFKFDVSKNSSLKVLLLRLSRRVGSKNFTTDTWFQSIKVHLY